MSLAKNVGAPMYRACVFFLAVRRDADVSRLKIALQGVSLEEMKAQALLPWNPCNTVPVHERLLTTHNDANDKRLIMLGNTVIPQMARMAFRLLAQDALGAA